MEQGQIVLSYVPNHSDLETLQTHLSSPTAVDFDDPICTGIEIIRLIVEQLQGTILAERHNDQIQIRVTLPKGNQLDGLPSK